MAVIYLKHPIHGGKVACSDMEADHDRANGWVDFDPYESTPAPAPAFFGNVAASTPLPDDFPSREVLVGAGFATLESLTGKTEEELKAIKGIGPATALKILDALEG